MKWSVFFMSAIGKKLVMALTGIFLISFLVVHVGVNACIWANDNGEMFNKAAHFMGSMVVIRIIEVGLFAGLVLHIIQGLVLWAQNSRNRKVGYAVSYGNRGSTWYSRSMGLLGSLLLLFLVMHLYHFWTPSRFGGHAGIPMLDTVQYGGKEYDNLFGEMVNVFQSPLVVVLYVLGCTSLAYHLLHGFQSAFRTLGLSNNRYMVLVHNFGVGFSILVPLAFAMMPLSVYFGWIGMTPGM
jgi:succinate dehydrogenase / fumarate reductase, cytochrome b subunit